MKVVILAGGYGTRLSEETSLKPKPMVEIGGKPILWHLMKNYAAAGFDDFIICCGYKGYVIKEYFANYALHLSDITFDMRKNEQVIHRNMSESWKVTLIDTGVETMTGGRLKRVSEYLDPDEDFLFTYGDGLSDVDLPALIEYHKEKNALATLTAVQPPGRYGSLLIKEGLVNSFEEKPENGGWINGGFFVCSPKVLDYIDDDTTIWERGPLENLSKQGRLASFKHSGFWHAMDTLRDRTQLEDMLARDEAPWKVW